MRPPPGSTLFPYTTLFRSTVQAGSSAGDASPAARPGMVSSEPVRRTDRKSTRLNSSHTVISYAVFCLKKKNHEGTQFARPAQAPRQQYASTPNAAHGVVQA